MTSKEIYQKLMNMQEVKMVQRTKITIINGMVSDVIYTEHPLNLDKLTRIYNDGLSVGIAFYTLDGGLYMIGAEAFKTAIIKIEPIQTA